MHSRRQGPFQPRHHLGIILISHGLFVVPISECFNRKQLLLCYIKYENETYLDCDCCVGDKVFVAVEGMNCNVKPKYKGPFP